MSLRSNQHGACAHAALTIRLVQSVFVDKYDPTIEDSYRKELAVDGRNVMLEILDTAGQEEYASLRPQYVRSGQGFLLVYAINDAKSFEELKTLYDEVLRIKDMDVGQVPVVIVGNKCDLEDRRQVQRSAVEDYAQARGCVAMETSAKNNHNVTEAFTELVRIMRIKAPQV
jgi:GTPase KRas protein